MKNLRALLIFAILALGFAAFVGGPFAHNALANGNTGKVSDPDRPCKGC